jgi:hypothetical protein
MEGKWVVLHDCYRRLPRARAQIDNSRSEALVEKESAIKMPLGVECRFLNVS